MLHFSLSSASQNSPPINMTPKSNRNADKNSSPHLTAAQLVLDVVDGGRSLDDALAMHEEKVAPGRRAWLHEIGYGACRYYHYFDRVLAALLAKPVKSRDRVVHFILLCACYQLTHMRAPDYAVVNESVAAVSGTRVAWSGKMINAVLRNFLARRDALEEDMMRDENAAARAAFPVWLYDEIRAHWSTHLHEIIAASNNKPPLTVRVNQRKINRDDYLKRLADAGIKATPTFEAKHGVTFAAPLPVTDIPGFADGLVSVQDEAAQLAAMALPPASGMRVLDGCAAPGGKTFLLLECEPKLAEIVAVDLPARVEKLTQNLQRLKLDDDDKPTPKIKIIAADLTQTDAWWNGELFDCIVLDVPCTGSGVIRRHPDIKHRRRATDLAQFARRQEEFLRAAWALLRDGGTLLYVTCSILPAENDAVIEKFLAATDNAQTESPAVSGIATRFGMQRLPGVHAGDGFYFCTMKKIAS